jgi:hypothetical protein
LEYVSRAGYQSEDWQRFARFDRQCNHPNVRRHNIFRFDANDTQQQFHPLSFFRHWRRSRRRHFREIKAGYKKRLQQHFGEVLRDPPNLPSNMLARKAAEILCDVPAFDTLTPANQQRWSLRILRVVWLLTDTEDMDTAEPDWMRDWKWGDDPYEWINVSEGPAGEILCGPCNPFPRSYARLCILQNNLDEWVKLTTKSLDRWAGDVSARDQARSDAAKRPADETHHTTINAVQINNPEAAALVNTAPPPVFPPMQFIDPNTGKKYDFGEKVILWELWRALFNSKIRISMFDLSDHVDSWRNTIVEKNTAKSTIQKLRDFWKEKGRPDIADKIRVIKEFVGYAISEES